MSTEKISEVAAPDTAKPPVALIAGPTASGKTDLAVRLALAIEAKGKRAVVINADSAQVYADLHILSARPTEDEMQGIEHRLFGTWDGSEACSAGDWARAAREIIDEVHAVGGVPILVGGTGLYMRTLLDGMAPVPEIPHAIRKTVREMPQEDARAALEAEDPEAAARLAIADRTRTTRALEVIRATRRTLSDWQSEKVGGIAGRISLHPLILLPDRDALYERCNRRFEQMIDHGAMEEAKALIARGLPAELPVMRAIGVRDIATLLKNQSHHDDMIEAGQQQTRNYAKRQFTWFRNQTPDDWPRLETYNGAVEDYFVSLFRQLALTSS